MNKTTITIIIAGFLLILACAEKKPEPLPEYEGWQAYSYKHFVYHYPEGCYWGRNMDSFSAGYEKYLAENCEFLVMEIPKDTIHFYIHNTQEAGKMLTGKDLPFHIDNQIFYPLTRLL